MVKLSLLLLLLLINGGFAIDDEVKDYSKNQVWRCYLNNAEDVEALQRLKEENYLDIWRLRHNYTDIQGPISQLQALKQLFLCEVTISNVQQLIDDEKREICQIYKRQTSEDAYEFFTNYHSFDEILNFLKSLVNDYPSYVTLIESIGQTVEGRDIPAVQIKGTEDPAKTIFFSAGIHAREWIAPATVLYFMKKLLIGAAAAEKVEVTMLNNVQFVIVPSANPDGYIYSWTKDRMWRKNRRPAPSSNLNCLGVDLNRNFDNHWGGVGASSYPCAEDYRGPSSASEPETQAIQKFVMTLPNRSGGIDFHSFGELILRSYGYTTAPPPNEDILEKVGNGMRDAINRISGKKYSSERAAQLYPTTGSTDDWYTQTGGMWGWTIELRDTGVYGFKLPANQIIATGEEIYEAIKYFTDQIIAFGPVSN